VIPFQVVKDQREVDARVLLALFARVSRHLAALTN
jgi:hypothetical protein